MTKILSSYKVIKSINVDTEKEKSLISTKLNSHKEEEFIVEKPIRIIDEDNEINLNEAEIISGDIKAQVLKELKQEIQEERANIIRIAMVEAENLKSEAMKQGQELGLQKGYEQGYEQGFKKGSDEARIESEWIRQNALDMVKQAEKNVEDYYKTNKINMINLASEMAESIIHNAIDTSSENLLMMIRPILEKYGNKGNITISCHPDNFKYLKDNLQELEGYYPESKFILFEDGSLEKNGCIVENKTQILDLQIKKQLDSIMDDIKHI